MKKTALVVALLVFAAANLGLAQENGFTVIANSSVSADSMSKKDLTRIFLKQKSRWPDGQRTNPVDHKLGSEVRDAFNREVLGKNPAQIESYWNGQVFAGKASPPPTFGSNQEILSYVRSTPGAVGYVAAGTATDGVKQLQVRD